ncbi:hypothetical protein [Paenibacillus sp. KR2-11]|uniref:hypothetical protein n=1 Tax=Paenibacillus sp. KR2-11 TaxID=3385500 RepID=UPI0038FC73E3
MVSREQAQELQEGMQIVITKGITLQLVRVDDMKNLIDTVAVQATQIMQLEREVKRLEGIELAVREFILRMTRDQVEGECEKNA